MHDRRELVLRLVQALGLAWIALAFSFYAFPGLMIGRGISLIALPLALGLMVGWRVSIHWFLGHPDFGERILIVGSGNLAVEVAREVLNRPDAGYRIVGFVGTDAELLGKSLDQSASDWPDRAARRDRQTRRTSIASSSPWASDADSCRRTSLLQLSLAGQVSIEEGASFYERVTGRVSLNMIRPSWLIFSGRGRQAKLAELSRNVVHWLVALDWRDSLAADCCSSPRF